MANPVYGIDGLQRLYGLETDLTNWDGPFINTALVSVAVGSDSQLWGINGSQQIFKWYEGNWLRIPGGLVSIAVGSDGQVWGINGSQQVLKRSGVSLEEMPGLLVRIAVNGSQVWGINGQQQIFKWSGVSWQQNTGVDVNQAPVGLVAIAVG
jgi:virginiamycin B lyase